MSRLGRIWDAIVGRQDPVPTGKRLYYSGATLYGGGGAWLGMLRAKDQEVRADVAAMRSNSRRLLNNNPFMRRYIRTLGNHVVGPNGMKLQSLFRTSQGARRDPYASKIESDWKLWSKRGTTTVCGKFSFPGLVRQALRIAALDGECFIRIVRGAPNPWGFALQILDADLLNHQYSRLPSPETNNHSIVMGVEIDEWDRPVAYHFTTPASARNTWPSGPVTIIPAKDIIHLYDPERANQTRGIPWIASSMWLMSMLGHYWEAEVASARHEAERLGILKSPDGVLDEDGVDRDGEERGNHLPDPRDVAALMPNDSPIKYQGLPAGVDVDFPKLEHPNTAFAGFSAGMLKGISAGVGIGYASLSNDLTQVSFSSIRQGTLEDREYYQELQQVLIETLCDRTFGEWGLYAIMAGRLKMPSGTALDDFFDHRFIPRGWDWVDPKSDLLASVGEVDGALNSRTRICAERGLEFTEVVDELAAEQDYLKSKGITLGPPPTSMKAADDPGPEAGGDETSQTPNPKGGTPNA